MTQTFVYVTLEHEFVHRYVDAPDEVAYLRNYHRHIAHIKVQVEVFCEDREIEFIMLKHELQEYLSMFEKQMDSSCETLASILLNYMKRCYGENRDMMIIVNEDNENGCEVIYRKES